MKRLVCSRCGFKTNAVAESATKVLCLGCQRAQKVTFASGWMKEELEAAARDWHNQPDWMKQREAT